MTARYTTTAAVQQRGRIPDGWEDVLGGVIAAAESEIDDYCGRHFHRVSGTARSFEIGHRTDLIACGDWTLIVRVLVNGEEIAANGYKADRLATWNRPAQDLRLTNPARPGDVATVTGTFGWAAIPAAVVEAATLLAIRLFRRGEFSEGIVAAESGTAYIPRQDPDVARLLRPYRRVVTAA